MSIKPATSLFMIFTLVFSACFTSGTSADTLRIATAVNFSTPIKKLARRFESDSGDRVLVSTGSTGELYAQIRNGAPFDAFFAADGRRPLLLETEGLAIPDSRFIYAVGRLVLWSPTENYVDSQGAILGTDRFRRLSLANPKLAPYGDAARQVLRHLRLWDGLATRRVLGENVGQAFQFVASGSAELGFVALSQITRPGTAVSGSYWLIPQTLYSPIEQHAVTLSNRPSVRRFMAFVSSETGRAIVQSYGYDLSTRTETARDG